MGKTLELLLSGILGIGSVIAPQPYTYAQPAAPASQDLQPPQAPGQKAQMPSDNEIKLAEKEIRDVYKDEYKLTDPVKKKAFADKLLANGSASTNNAQKYVLLREAANTLSDLLELSATYDTVKSMKDNFEGYNAIDAYDKYLTAAQKKSKTKEDASKIAEAYIQLADASVDERNFKIALSSAKSAETIGKKAGDASLVEKASDLTKAIPDMEKEYACVKKAEETLKLNPNDPEANLTVGKYLAFVDNDWDAALKLLAKSINGVSKIAEQEITLRSNGYENTESVAQVADLWYEQSNKSTNVLDKKRFATRAFELYKQAQPKATGLTKDKIAKKISELKNKVSPSKNGVAKGGLVDLMKLIDPTKDTISGNWKFENNKLVSDNTAGARIQISYQPPEEYDYQIVFTRLEGKETVMQILNKSGRSFSWIMGGWNNSVCGFETVKGRDSNDNPTTVKSGIENGKTYTSLLQVRNEGIKAFLDGKLISEWKEFNDMKLGSFWKLRDENALGLGTWLSPTQFHKIEVKEISGKGRKLR